MPNDKFSFELLTQDGNARLGRIKTPRGLIDTPSAGAISDGEFSFTTTKIGPFLRNTVSFQAVPWANASFRYSGIGDVEGYFIESF